MHSLNSWWKSKAFRLQICELLMESEYNPFLQVTERIQEGLSLPIPPLHFCASDQASRAEQKEKSAAQSISQPTRLKREAWACFGTFNISVFMDRIRILSQSHPQPGSAFLPFFIDIIHPYPPSSPAKLCYDRIRTYDKAIGTIYSTGLVADFALHQLAGSLDVPHLCSASKPPLTATRVA